ncbi:ATP-binding protein [Ignisphaera sp. 4213-co]|uniref:ATP-binding protein n=1 Tax=Ignisphaera cupida TaxID=3050454 RepID=A0ABD4Z8V3_9CREN|nr:ATP-binding protein [Ignisphaera sp. 4213-co]MDK6029357.1 ATP-binding protein [Ignisphaera sp. 4213-co]
MLFDPKPKRCRKDLYDFNEEFNMLSRFLGEPLVVVTGLRRTGKTSLILTVLEESGKPYIFVDARSVSRSWRDLYTAISTGFSDFMAKASRFSGFRDSLLRFLKIIKGVSVMGVSIEFSWGRDRPLLTQIFTALNEAAEEHNLKIIIVFDEAQLFTGVFARALQNAIAYSYDHLKNLSFIVSGSEMNVLYKWFRDPEAPLYGRAFLEVKTRRLSREESMNFLEKGFSELGYRVPMDEIEMVVNKLDGVIGWLTYYGYLRVFQNRLVDDIWREAVELARKELENFLMYRVSRERYRKVLRLLAQGVREWGKLKQMLENAEGKTISDRVLHEILHTLRNHTIIDDENNFLDPITREAAKTL